MGSAISNFMCLCSGLLRTNSVAQRAVRPRFQQLIDWLPGSPATRGGSNSHATADHEWNCCGIIELRPGQPPAARLAAPVWAAGDVPLPDPGAAGALVTVHPMGGPGRLVLVFAVAMATLFEVHLERDQSGVRSPPWHGDRRVHMLLRRGGRPVNLKRVRRLYRLEGLQSCHRVRRREDAGLHRGILPPASRAHER